jgi:hypothetical protein
MTESNDFISSLLAILWSGEKPRRINPGSSRDRNGADYGTGASGAIDIRPRDGSSGSGRRRSSKVCLAGIRG